MKKEKYYKREGRRFVQTNIPVDNVGKYYQKDGSFVEKRNENSLGLCIISSVKEHVVMTFEDVFEAPKENLPTRIELITAFELFKEKCNLNIYRVYKTFSYGGVGCLYVSYDPDDLNDYYGSRLIYNSVIRPVIRIKNA